MPLLLHDKELTELMENFYVLTGMRIVLFDESYSEIVSYPQGSETFCSYMRCNSDFNCKCCESDAHAFDACRRSKSLYISRCHAGLTEATAPILENEKIIGYMMFGQITDRKGKEEFFERMDSLCNEYGVSEDAAELVRKIKYRSKKQIQAASKIFEACTGYIQLKEMVHLSEKRLIDRIDEFVDAHIGEEISIDRLCKKFDLSRTRLYDIMRQYISGGVATFIRKKRLRYAKRLLESGTMPIADIACACGFSEYNYFLRTFKAEFGISPKNYSKSFRSN